MLTWINWRELEKLSGWAPSIGDGKFNEIFDAPEQIKRAQTLELSEYFDNQQADAMRLRRDETVLDACCGLGRLSLPMANRCKHVTALDGSANRLQYVRDMAAARGIGNITTLQANWFELDPEKDLPQFDVVVGCNCPALADVVKFSGAAKKRCIYLHSCRGAIPNMVYADLYAGVLDMPSNPVNPRDDYWFSPKNSFDISFNRLINLGAAPTINYCDAGWHLLADSRKEIYDRLSALREIPAGREEAFRKNIDRHIVLTANGYLFERKHLMVIMEWNPQDIFADRA